MTEGSDVILLLICKEKDRVDVKDFDDKIRRYTFPDLLHITDVILKVV